MRKKHWIIIISLICIVTMIGVALVKCSSEKDKKQDNSAYNEDSAEEKEQDTLPMLPADSDSKESESSPDEKQDELNSETEHLQADYGNLGSGNVTSDTNVSPDSGSSESTDSSDSESSELTNSGEKAGSVEMPFVPFD